MEQLYELFQNGRKFKQRHKKYLLFLLAIVIGLSPLDLSANYLNKQTPTVTVSGKVTDETGSPLPGVNIIEKGTTNGTVSA